MDDTATRASRTPPDTTDRFLVLGDDLSPGADLAWLWVVSQRWPGWTMVDLRAEVPVPGSFRPSQQPEPSPISGPPPREVPGEPGFDEVRFVTMAADPRLALGTWSDAELVVVGGSASGAGPYSIGSTTEWLLHDSSAPVLVARRGRPVHRVVACADGSEHATAAAETFAAMPWAHSADVSVVAIDDGRIDVAASIDKLVGVMNGTVASVAEVTRAGRSPHKAILTLADEIDADLIVLGTHGLSTMRRLTVGSTAGAVARLGHASVLAARTHR